MRRHYEVQSKTAELNNVRYQKGDIVQLEDAIAQQYNAGGINLKKLSDVEVQDYQSNARKQADTENEKTRETDLRKIATERKTGAERKK